MTQLGKVSTRAEAVQLRTVTRHEVITAPVKAAFSYALLSTYDPNYMSYSRDTGRIGINADNGYFEYQIDEWSGDGREALATRVWPTPDED